MAFFTAEIEDLKYFLEPGGLIVGEVRLHRRPEWLNRANDDMPKTLPDHLKIINSHWMEFVDFASTGCPCPHLDEKIIDIL